MVVVAARPGPPPVTAIDDAERVEENIDDVDDEQEETSSATTAETRWSRTRRIGPAPSIAPGLDDAFGDRLQGPARKKQEIIRNLLPHTAAIHDEDQRVVCRSKSGFQSKFIQRSGRASVPSERVEHEDPEHARHRGAPPA